MSDLERWHENNSRYLATALHWLRLRLGRLAALEETPSSDERWLAAHVSERPAAPPKTGLRNWFRKTVGVQPDRPLLPAPQGNEDNLVEEAARVLEEAALSDPPPALVSLAQRFDLSTFEREILLLCAAVEFDAEVRGLCAQAQNDPSRPFPTFSLALDLFEDPAWEAVSPERPLRYWRLIEINQPGAQPLAFSALRADERIVNLHQRPQLPG